MMMTEPSTGASNADDGKTDSPEVTKTPEGEDASENNQEEKEKPAEPKKVHNIHDYWDSSI